MTDNKYKMMIDELVRELGFDGIKSLVKSTTPTISEEQLKRAIDAIMNRHGDKGEQQNE
jgi:hypothetical protein